MTKFTKSVLATASLLALGVTASAQTYDFDLSKAKLDDACTYAALETKSLLTASSDKEFALAVENAAQQRAQRNANKRPFRADYRKQRQTQVVFLDFGSEDPTFRASVGGSPFGPGSLIDGVRTPGIYADFEYDAEDRAFILDSMRQDFAAFNIRFTDVEPRFGDYSVIRIGDNDANPIDLAGGILFGRADAIDFGNDDRNDTAFADASLWQLLAEVEAGSESTIFTRNNGGLPTGTPEELDNSRKLAVRRQSANTGAHELGHILGLRHHDSFGGIGEGLPPARSGFEFWPFRPDLNRVALETFDHLMASGASTGISLQAPITASRFISERSANKLTINEKRREYLDDSLKASRGFLPFSTMNVPNTLESGVNAGRRFKVRNVTIAGSIDTPGEVDTFRLNLRAGDVFSAEGHTWTDDTLSFPDETIAGLQISLYKVDNRGNRELVELNQTTFEAFDPMLMDVEIEESGKYELDVEVPRFLIYNGGANGFDLGEPGNDPFGNLIFRTGEYRLFAYTISTPLSAEERGVGGGGFTEVGFNGR